MDLLFVDQPLPQDQVQHKYGTRKRQNSLMRPSVRLREGALPLSVPIPPRRIRPLGTVTSNFLDDITKPPKSRLQCEIEFPPSHVVLHPDDASSKTFMAMGRAFLSQVSFLFPSSINNVHPCTGLWLFCFVWGWMNRTLSTRALNSTFYLHLRQPLMISKHFRAIAL